MNADKYIDLLVHDHIDGDGLLNGHRIKRKKIILSYLCFLMTINGFWKIVTQKRLSDLKSKFKEMTIQQSCDHINDEIKSKGLITTNKFTQNMRKSFMAGKKDDDTMSDTMTDTKTVLQLNPIVKFDTGDYKLHQLPTVKIIAAESPKRKKKEE